MLLRLHIWRRALHYKKKYVNIKQKLQEANDISFVDNTNIIFTWLLSGISKHPNAMSVFPGLIVVNAEWAARLVIFDTEEVRDSYRYTIGHEMTHQSGDYVFWEAFTKDKRFVNWVSEVHADYGGTVHAFAGNIRRAVTAIEYKAKDYKNDRDRQVHPSWLHRKGYLKIGRFDSELIKCIADDVGCRNQVLIDKVSDYYSPIELEVPNEIWNEKAKH